MPVTIRRCALLLCFVCLLAACTAVFAEQEKAPLGADEMMAWRDGVWSRLRTLRAAGEPVPADLPDGARTYLYAYPFGVVTCDAQTLDGQYNPISQVELIAEGMTCPRGIGVGDPLASVLDAYPCESAELAGDFLQAALYIQEDDEAAGWGVVQRRGETIERITLTALLAVEDGGFMPLTLAYEIVSDEVREILVTGFDARITGEERGKRLEALKSMRDQGEFGGDAARTAQEGLMPEDLQAGGVSFVSGTPEECAAAFGDPLSDITDDGGMRTLLFEGILVEFLEEDGRWRMESLQASEDVIQGPGGIRAGDLLEEVTGRFGGADTEDGAATYTCEDESGDQYALSCFFRRMC
ncbi:hypothetical protein LJC74_00555 [Eubacteriales bacterium OttesenSCG-928-A19]|nr:hypothetical protein [Eubacteriales bacterium OttesenSCG-928-A19]